MTAYVLVKRETLQAAARCIRDNAGSSGGRVGLEEFDSLLEMEVILAAPCEPDAYWVPRAEQFCIKKKGERPFGEMWKPLYAPTKDAS